ncbi:16S rRNA (cytidine(1402)-2'-O)-methyltransferase [Candidatus Parcubacteria bacterium]|nr:MAG: 16S rRNA (cytidine(1402)-2'-O)-methyltransferase [Candidatus Parcubacteria bacterium]
MSKLYIVATPIGNLEDITMRAVRVLKEVDLILAEDKRVSRKLLDHYAIKKNMLSWHQHSKIKDWHKIKEFLNEGKDIALVTDAGTPGVSDPGGKLIELILSEVPDTEIIPLPGPSSLTAIVSIAGVPMDKFLFLGYLPHKKGRQTLFETIKSSDIPVVFFESVHRILKALDQLSDCDKKLIIGRELTKKFETVYRGQAKDILEILSKDKEQQKGEFVVVVNNQ